jgi:hypothetical protein
VSSLLKHYFTDEKICETLARCEAHGVNTAILRVDERTLRVLDRYRKKDGGKIQWIAQAKSKDDDYTSDAKIAIDHGALGVYLQGGVGDDLAKEGRVDKIGKVVDFIQRNQVVAGVAGHNLEVPMACEKAGLKPDFYMKTFNSKRYWSAGPLPRHDSVWEETPEQTKAFMQEVARPWIAFKVLGAGAIHPNEGFRYAFENGADFICVGMFDFQVAEDVRIALNALDRAQRRERAWSA